MSVVTNPLIGQARQSMGGATFSRWKGIQVLKNKASTVANPNSELQQQQRDAFRQVVAIFRANAEAIRAGFKKLAVRQSEFNAFSSYSLKNSFDLSSPPVATLVPSDLLVSKGTMTPTALGTIVADRSANSITIAHATTAADASQTTDDKAIVAVYNTSQSQWAYTADGGERSEATAEVAMPAGWIATDNIVAYLGFTNPTSGDQSNSNNGTGTIVA